VSDSEITTIDDLRNANFKLSGESAAIALAQAEKRLSDTLAAKESFERKATTLLRVWISLASALTDRLRAHFASPDAAPEARTCAPTRLPVNWRAIDGCGNFLLLQLGRLRQI
jgi:hypothetical protein